jgi:hypothetical protein
LSQLQLCSQTQQRFALAGADIVGTVAFTVFTESQKAKLSNGYSSFAFMFFSFFVPISFFSFGRFVAFLTKQNPRRIELLAAPELGWRGE